MNPPKRFLTGLTLATALQLAGSEAIAAQAPVNLGTAGNFVILAKSGISTVPASAVVGDMGVSPIDSTAITGFSLNVTTGDPFATSSQVTGKIYAADFGIPTPVYLTTAVGDMLTAYDDAAGRTNPDFTELGAGEIGGLTLAPGLYKWGTSVSISSDVTLNGGPNAVWILQVAQKTTQANGTKVHLTGGAVAKNVFWQAFGSVTIGTTAHFEGILMAKTSISLATGASINGRLLAQTAVTLDANAVNAPAAVVAPILDSAILVTGPYGEAIGQTFNSAKKTLTVPRSANTSFYRLRSGSSFVITGIVLSGPNVEIALQ